MVEQKAPSRLLIFGYGNPSRGDDALGPECLKRLESELEDGRISTAFDSLTDFQLQIEHALDLEGRELVLFIDASVSAGEPFRFSPVTPLRDESYTSHAMTPAAVLAVHSVVGRTAVPAAFTLGITGYDFQLGNPLSDKARTNLEEAMVFLQELLMDPAVETWRALC